MKKKILIGPHHGEYNFENWRLNNGCGKFRNIGYIANDEEKGTEERYIHTEDILPYLETHEHIGIGEHELDWGWWTELIYDDTQIETLSGKSLEETQEIYLRGFLDKLKNAYLLAYLGCSGDDDTFDYMPSFTDCLEDILTLFGEEELITKIRKICLMTHDTREEAEGMEYFSDEELDAHFKP